MQLRPHTKPFLLQHQKRFLLVVKKQRTTDPRCSQPRSGRPRHQVKPVQKWQKLSGTGIEVVSAVQCEGSESCGGERDQGV